MYKLIKPWGEESTWTKTGNYEAKILHINVGEKLSTKYHKEKDFSILVTEGKLDVTLGEGDSAVCVTVENGQTLRIPPRQVHRFCANYGPVSLIEVGTPQADDAVRISDAYGRICDGD